MSERSAHLVPADIYAAADSLLREKQEMPSDRDVLVRLGRGSLTTINRGMIKWRKSKALSLLDLAQPDVPEPVMNLAREMWTQAMTGATALAIEQLAAREAALADKQRQFEQGAEELRLRAKNAEALLDVEKRERDRVAADSESLGRQLSELKQHAGTLSNRIGVLEADGEARAQQLTQSEARERTLTQQLSQQTDQHREAVGRAEERHAAEIRLHVQRIEDQRGRADRVEAAASKAASRADARIETLEARLADVEKARNELSMQATALTAERDTWRARAEERDTSISMLQKSVDSLREAKVGAAVPARVRKTAEKRQAVAEPNLFSSDREP